MALKHRFSNVSQLIHGHQGNRGSESRSHAFPIYQTSTFRFDTVEQGMEIFAGTAKYDAYSRISSPNHRFLEDSLCVLEDGEAAQVFDSGTGVKLDFEKNYKIWEKKKILSTPAKNKTL